MVTFDKIIGLLTKSLYLTLRVFLIFVIPLNILFSNLFGSYNTDILLIVSILLYLISLLITKQILSTEENKQKNAKIFLFISLILSVVLSLILFNNMPIYIYALGILYFIFLLYDSVKNSTRKENLDRELNSTIKTILIFIVLIVLAKISLDKPAVSLNRYLILYFLISLVYLCRINIKSEYESMYHDTINKSKNMVLFNIISVALIAFLYLSKDITYIIINGFKYFAGIILKFAEFVITKIIYYIAYFFVFLISKTPLFKKKIEYEDINISDIESTKIVLESSSGSNIIGYIIKSLLLIFFILIIIKIIKAIYKKIAEYLTKQSETEDTEEKEFVYEGGYLLNNIKNRIQNIMNKLRSKEELYYIRKIYKNNVNKLISKGYMFKKYYTPNEYIKKLPQEQVKELKFNELTKAYNDYRYGHNMSVKYKQYSESEYNHNTE